MALQPTLFYISASVELRRSTPLFRRVGRPFKYSEAFGVTQCGVFVCADLGTSSNY